jgi:16S rRNA (guanine527-N7)-methyltransferase
MTIEPTSQFLEAAERIGIAFDAGDVGALGKYLELLFAANETMNLTAVRDVEQAWMRHILDSLTLLPLLADLPERGRVIDIGSGGGLPGIPLAITMPHLSFTLLEATGKKAVFLRGVADQMNLKNVSVLNQRAEIAAHDRGMKKATGRFGGHRETYDAVVARAVGRLHTLAEITVPFAKPTRGEEPGGIVLLIKGAQADAELAEAQGALHALKAVHTGTIETPTGRIVMLAKGAATPKLYPRHDGEPKRSPLAARKPDVKPDVKPDSKPELKSGVKLDPARGDA